MSKIPFRCWELFLWSLNQGIVWVKLQVGIWNLSRFASVTRVLGTDSWSPCIHLVTSFYFTRTSRSYPQADASETMTSLDYTPWAVASPTPSPPYFLLHLQDNQASEANMKVRYCWQPSCRWGCVCFSLKLGDGNELQTSGGLAKESREWLQMGEKVLAAPEGPHTLTSDFYK